MMGTNIHLSDGEMKVSTSKILDLYSLTIAEVETSCNVTAFLTLDQMKQIKNELTVSINYFEKEYESCEHTNNQETGENEEEL